MEPVANPEVLSNDWLPPVPIAREHEVREVVRRLDPPRPVAPPPWIVGVAGPSGSGSSTVARRAAREVLEELRRSPSHRAARLLALRVAFLKGPHGVATALLQRFDDGFDGRGFPVPEILAGFLRRLRREGRALVLVLDDIGLGGPDLGPVLRAIASPDRFLPEGEHGLPPIWTVLAGSLEGLERVAGAVGPGPTVRPFVELRAYAPELLSTIVADRALRALGREAPSGWVRPAVAAAVEEGGGSRRAIDHLRRHLLSRGVMSPAEFVAREADPTIAIEPWLLGAFARAGRVRSPRLGDVRRWQAELARRQGSVPLPATTLWRRVVRLERAGYLRREVRTGGDGGSRSIVRLLVPVDEWLTGPVRPRTHPSAAAPDARAEAAAGPTPPRPEWPGATVG